MAIWIQSLSWALIYSLVQGVAVYVSLRLVFKILPTRSANARYHLSLSALTVLLAWFVATWWQQFHSLTLANGQLQAVNAANTTVIWLPLQHSSAAGSLANWRMLLLSVEAFFPWLSAFYIAGLVLMLARFSAGMSHLFSLRRRGTFPPGAAMDELLLVLKKRIGLDVPVKLLASAKAQVPMVIGFLKPIVLIPTAAMAQLSPQQLETILLHELAHIKRHDYLVNILQTIVETMLFFNPFVWLISTITRREREHCCDDMVVDNTPEPISYATALAALASHRRPASLIVAATGHRTPLFNRIQRIMEIPRGTFSYSRLVATLIIIVAIIGSIAWVRPSFPKIRKGKAATTGKKSTDAPPARIGVPKIVNDKEMPKEAVVDAANGTPALSGVQMQAATAAQDVPEEKILVDRLLAGKMVDQVKGFVVEKRKNSLYINGVLVDENVAAKYLQNLEKEWIRVQVRTFEERMRMHPDADFLQILLPSTFESPCVDKRAAKKEGC
jgi:beta-lactamase regulating signal transducer with metallopeptidase domain